MRVAGLKTGGQQHLHRLPHNLSRRVAKKRHSLPVQIPDLPGPIDEDNGVRKKIENLLCLKRAHQNPTNDLAHAGIGQQKQQK